MFNSSTKGINYFADFLVGLLFTISIFLFILLPQLMYFNLMFTLMSILLFAFMKFNSLKIVANSSLIFLAIFILFSFLGLFVAKGTIDGANTFVIQLGVVFVVQFFLTGNIDNVNMIYRGILFISIILLVGNIVQLCSPTLLSNINSIHLQGHLLNTSLDFIREGALTSFTYNTGINAFFLMILLCVLLNQLLSSQKKIASIFYIISFLLIFYLLVATYRRTHLLTFIIIVIITFIIRYKLKFKSIFYATTLISVILLIFINIGVGQEIIERFMLQDNINELTTGRWPVYQQMWEDFLESPIIGKGTYTTPLSIYLSYGHNIYLQILRENGILGLIPFLGYLIANLFHVVIAILNSTTNKYKKYLITSLQIQLSFILIGLTENPLYEFYTLLVYVIATSVALTIPLKLRQKALNNFPRNLSTLKGV